MIQERSFDTIKVLDIPLYAKDIPSAVDIVLEDCKMGIKNNFCISATGAHGLVQAKRDIEFNNVLKSFFLNLPDGMPGVWVGRLKGAKYMRRCYGPDFFSYLIRKSSSTTIRHYFCGGNPGVAEQLKNSVMKKFGNSNVVGTFCPPFLKLDEYDYSSIANDINQSDTDVVWVGLSTPKQELFAYRLAKRTKVSFIITVGAAFDFHTGRVRQSPAFLQRAGLEWLFRLLMEPRRLYKRYFQIVPLFIYFNLRDFFGERTR